MSYIFLNILSCFAPAIFLAPVLCFVLETLESKKKIWQKIVLITISFVFCKLTLEILCKIYEIKFLCLAY